MSRRIILFWKKTNIEHWVRLMRLNFPLQRFGSGRRSRSLWAFFLCLEMLRTVHARFSIPWVVCAHSGSLWSPPVSPACHLQSSLGFGSPARGWSDGSTPGAGGREDSGENRTDEWVVLLSPKSAVQVKDGMFRYSHHWPVSRSPPSFARSPGWQPALCRFDLRLSQPIRRESDEWSWTWLDKTPSESTLWAQSFIIKSLNWASK